MSGEIIITEDGSATLYVPELNENYHSTHGAVQESMHIFIGAGLNAHPKKKLNIFEMGFGTGLNCILTYLHSKSCEINYFTLEKYPLEKTIVEKLNYPDCLKLTKSQKDVFYHIHESAWESEIQLTPHFRFTKLKSDIKTFSFEQKFDLIYYDAFAPEIQPLLWSEDVFRKIYHSLNENGIMVTYCAKGAVRRTFQNCGFKVERLPGPPGKREMLRAIKQ